MWLEDKKQWTSLDWFEEIKRRDEDREIWMTMARRHSTSEYDTMITTFSRQWLAGVTVSPCQCLDHVAAQRFDNIQHLVQQRTGRVRRVPPDILSEVVQLLLLDAQCCQVLVGGELTQDEVIITVASLRPTLGHQLLKPLQVRLHVGQVVDVDLRRRRAALALWLCHRRWSAFSLNNNNNNNNK